MNEYLAPAHQASSQVLDLKEDWDGLNSIGMRRKLNALIKVHPDLIEAYNLRREILLFEDHLVAANKETVRAYKAVMEHYFPNGELPDSMPWGWLENRPILLALTHYAVHLWVMQKKEEAHQLFKQLLKMNPDDNQGARFYYLAFLEGISYTGFSEISKRGELRDWFKALAGLHEELKSYV